MKPYFAERAPNPKLPPFEWPKVGVRTWRAPEKSFFGACNGRPNCNAGPACPVGVVVTVGVPYGCACPCHEPGADHQAQAIAR